MSERHAMLWVALAALAGLAMLILTAPDYLVTRGFPLDDSWIHAVYGRSVARSLSLAYNPGIPATGATSPLWVAVVAIPHLLSSGVDAIVGGIKAIGFGLHALAAVLLLHAFARHSRVDPLAVVGAGIVALHPDLVSAAVSGMEVPLATAFAAALLLAARGGSWLSYLAVSTIAPLARPELGLLCIAIPIVLYVRIDVRRSCLMAGAGAAGAAMSFGALAVRNIAASGLPLPATFYAKAGADDLAIPAAELEGFSRLLAQFPVADSAILLAAAALVALVVVVRPGPDRTASLAAAALLGALAYCAVSFGLVPPFDPVAFYHQRFVLPVLPLILASLPPLLDLAMKRVLPGGNALAWGRGALVALLAAAVLLDAPTRYARLDNDARNVDDVQVAIGRSLAALPGDHVVWAIDAGAVRYFGSPLVVDLLGLNNGELLGSGAQAFLDARPPHFIQVVPTWASLDDGSARQLRGYSFSPSTRYTVTGLPSMQQHIVVRCDLVALRGALRVRARTFDFTCPT
jgi:hypothetical protein